MEKSNALEIIRSFSKQEFAEFNDFLRSPFFNKKSGILKLYNEIAKYYPDFSDSGLERENLWVKLYPGKEFNYGVMKNLIQDLTKLAEQYITQKEYCLRELQQFENLYASLSKRNLKSVYLKKESLLNKYFTASDYGFKNMAIDEYYGRLTKIYEIKLWDSTFYDQQVNLNEDINCMVDSFITGMLIHLINIHYLAKVASFNDKGKNININPAEIILSSIPENVINHIVKDINNRSVIKSQFIKGYFLAHKANLNKNESSYYFEFKNFILNNYQYMAYNFLKDMDTYLMNALSSIKDPRLDKKSEYYSLHHFRHKNNLIVERNNQLNSIQFIPWMFLFLDENKINELEEYINSYKKYIVDEDREPSHMFANAMVFFLKSDFKQAFSIINKIKFKSVMLKNIVKKLALMVCYELKDFESFNFAYDSYKHFLNYGDWAKREWIEHYTKKNKIFAGLIATLFNLWESGSKKEISAFEKEILYLNIENKKWFLRKINELKMSQTQ